MNKDIPPGADEASLFVDFVRIEEFSPITLSDDQVEAALLRNFLNLFNNLLFVLIQNIGDVLQQITSDHVTYGQLKEIASAADQLQEATKRLQKLVEGTLGFRGTGTILVADDQETVRKVVVRNLEQYGYTVFGVSGGLEALEKCKSYPGPIHVVLADVGMVPMDGYELIRKVLSIRPETKAIYMSGNYPNHARLMPGTAFLLKPTELMGLPEKIWHMLNMP